MVTVAPLCKSSSASALPTMLLRADHDRSPAFRVDSLVLEELHHTERGTGYEARMSVARSPTFVGWKPSTSFRGLMASNTRCPANCGAEEAAPGCRGCADRC